MKSASQDARRSPFIHAELRERELSQNLAKEDVAASLWDRLSAPAEALDLERLSDEEPEDLFVRLAQLGDRASICAALRAQLIRVVTGRPTLDDELITRFLPRALKLCDALVADECKSILKHLLLIDDPAELPVDLTEIQGLAARALLACRKDESDFLFWAEVAQRRNAASPYALNAAIEIDLPRGIELLYGLYEGTLQRERQRIADWATIFQVATDVHGEDALGEVLDAAVAAGSDTQQRLLKYKFFVRFSGIQSLSLRYIQASEDILEYAKAPSGSSKEVSTVSVNLDLDQIIRALQNAASSHVAPSVPPALRVVNYQDAS